MKDATYLANGLRTKQFSLEELFTETKRKIEKFNPEINAFVTLEALDFQSNVKRPQLESDSLLAGIPFPLKMLGQEKKGWLATSGSRIFEEHRASKNSNYVQAVEKAGLVSFGQTNAPEFGFKNITDPQLYGPARNPWNLAYSPGGSSGGAAAAVAAGIVPMAGASDGGGSIRIPASFSGLIGLKPSRGTMPVGPNAWRGWQGAAIDFGLTISMRDTKALFQALQGINSGAPYQVTPAFWQQHPVKERLKIAVCVDSPIGSKVSVDAQIAVQKALHFLEQSGHEIVEIPYPLDGRTLINSYYQMNGAETAAMIESIENGLQRGIESNELEPISWTLWQYGKKLSAADYVQSLHVWDHAAVTMESLFESFDLFLSPTTADTAPKITADLQSDLIRQQMADVSHLSADEGLAVVSAMFEESLTITPYTQLANLTGQPAISLPTHVSEQGLPLGIQFMAARGREDLLFQIGELFEKHGLFYLPPEIEQA